MTNVDESRRNDAPTEADLLQFEVDVLRDYVALTLTTRSREHRRKVIKLCVHRLGELFAARKTPRTET